MENETSEKTRLNNNKLGNINENTNDKSKICEDYNKKTLFISFLSVARSS